MADDSAMVMRLVGKSFLAESFCDSTWPREFRAHHAPIAGVAGGSQTYATMGPDGTRSIRGKDTFITSLLQIFTVCFGIRETLPKLINYKHQNIKTTLLRTNNYIFEKKNHSKSSREALTHSHEACSANGQLLATGSLDRSLTGKTTIA